MGNKYSGFYGNGYSSQKEASQQKASVERLNAILGIRDRQVEVKQNSSGRYYVEETRKR